MSKVFNLKNVAIFALLLVCVALIKYIVREYQFQGMRGYNNYNVAYDIVPARSYQLDLAEDSIIVWDGNKYVGTIPMWDNSPLDILLIKDNK